MKKAEEKFPPFLVLGRNLTYFLYMFIPNSSVAKASKSSARESLFPKKTIYAFEQGGKEMKDLLGGKGANLAEMTKIGLPVPHGFTITTEVCDYFLRNGNYPGGFADELQANLRELERKSGKAFNDMENPLLVSVRSGAAASMPGMMDTILNLGLNDDTVNALAEATGSEKFAYDCYRRFIQMFADVVLNVPHELFEEELAELKKSAAVASDSELSAENLKELVAAYKKIVTENSKKTFPENPLEQLKLAIEAVFNSWNNERAKTYRQLNDIKGLKGTAVNIQMMVFGNMGNSSGTGVAFTRNPSTGEKEFFGEFLMNAQGEDVVAGIRTPLAISQLKETDSDAYEKLIQIKDILERHYRDMQDIEFTIEHGKLFILQTRSGKRTMQAALKIACDMARDRLISREEALLKIDPKKLNQLLLPQIKKMAAREVVAKGLPASPGAAMGKVAFTPEAAIEMAKKDKVILVRKETSPEDISGMHVAEGILTSRGGMTSHAAVVCRGMGKSCITGASDIVINTSAKKLIIGDLVINEGDIITLDGETGEVILGEVEMQEPKLLGDFKTIMDWADEVRRLKVRANADTPHDCRIAKDFGAEGIGLCRTEHMFFEEDRIHLVRQMILAKDEKERTKPLAKLKEIQKNDFKQIFKEMLGMPVLVRLLDPPLHEFLPESEDKIEELARDFEIHVDELKLLISHLKEANPMLGHRGCRLGISYPEIYKMQVQALTEAAIEVSKHGKKALVEIEIPLAGHINEFLYLKDLVQKTLLAYGEELNFEYKIGTMMEVPRACLSADEFAKHADFFSFGTNDLTQMTFGISRDDAGRFLPTYLEKNIFDSDPFATIDEKGVGKLMSICVNLGRSVNPDLEIGICGEQGGEPSSIDFCHRLGLNYVSLSPFRVPIARLAAAQAFLKNG